MFTWVYLILSHVYVKYIKEKLLFKEFFQKNDKLGILGYPKLNVKRKSPAKDSLLSLELEKIANGLLM